MEQYYFNQLSLQAHERLEDSKLEAVSDNNLELVNEILEDISPLISVDENVAELVGILKEPHFQVICPCPPPIAFTFHTKVIQCCIGPALEVHKSQTRYSNIPMLKKRKHTYMSVYITEMYSVDHRNKQPWLSLCAINNLDHQTNPRNNSPHFDHVAATVFCWFVCLAFLLYFTG